MTKPKTLDQLRAEKERAETQLAQEQHKLERLENRKKYFKIMKPKKDAAKGSSNLDDLDFGMVLFVVNEANRVENQVIMQMVFIDVSCQNKLILAA